MFAKLGKAGLVAIFSEHEMSRTCLVSGHVPYLSGARIIDSTWYEQLPCIEKHVSVFSV